MTKTMVKEVMTDETLGQDWIERLRALREAEKAAIVILSGLEALDKLEWKKDRRTFGLRYNSVLSDLLNKPVEISIVGFDKGTLTFTFDAVKIESGKDYEADYLEGCIKMSRMLKETK